MALPSDLTTITVTGTYTTINGTPLAGQVNFSISTPVEDSTGKVILGIGTQSATLNSNGFFVIVLPCTDNANLNPTGFSYLVTEVVPGLGRAYYVQLPHTLGSTVDLSQLAPVSTPVTPSTFASNNTWTGTQTFSGLKIIAGPAAGDLLTSDASGNATWQPLSSNVPLLNAANTFTTAPQNVGTSYAAGEIQLYDGQMYLAANGAAPPTVAPPFIKLYGYCGGATGNNGWDIGIDTANHGGGQDFYIGRVISGTTDDCFFIDYSSGAIGMCAAVPPSDSYAVSIEAKNSSMGGLLMTRSSGNTANMLQLQTSAGAPKFWIDSSFTFHSVNGITINGDNGGSGSIYYCANFTTASGNTFSFYKTADSNSANLRLRYLNTNTDVFNVDTSANVQFYTAVRFEGNVGFYNTAPVSQPTAGDVTAGFTANSGTPVVSGSTFTGNNGSTAYTIGDVVAALKTLGLITA